MKVSFNLSIKSILMFVVIILGTVPLLLMQTIIKKTVREYTIENTTNLTRGILEQSQKYLNLDLDRLDTFSDNMVNNQELNGALDEDFLSTKALTIIDKLRASSRDISDIVIVDYNKDRPSYIFLNERDDSEIIDRDSVAHFLKSEQALLLRENSSRSLWVGASPTGISTTKDSVWNLRVLKSKKANYVVAVSISCDTLTNLIDTIRESTNSEVLLITADNRLFPENSEFFEYSFAPKTLSRIVKGRFTSFLDTRYKNNIFEPLLIQVYSDPFYFYNLVVLTPETNLLKGFDQISKTTTLSLVILSLLSIGFGLVGILFFKKRLSTLIDGVKSITHDSCSITNQKHLISIKEDVSLTNAVIEMADEVISNRAKLRQLNENLEIMVKERTKELDMIRESLIHSEKMASLSHNAAKITHEINNPLSISITASTHLTSLLEDLASSFDSNTLTKTMLSKFVVSSTEINSMIVQNLNRAAELTDRFKSFASDQASDKKRTINIKSYIEEIIKGYSFKLKNTGIIINFICQENHSISTYPSIIYQAITNLVNNSLLHGFENRKDGIIELIIHKYENSLDIVVKDNGIGISSENIIKLYTPFFTTKQSKGGTGLGLNIIKDLINNKLNGTIECKSVLGEGSEFTINIPIGD